MLLSTFNTFEDVIVHIRIEEKNRLRGKASLAKEFASKANLIESGSRKPQFRSQQNFKEKIIILNLIRIRLIEAFSFLLLFLLSRRKEIVMFVVSQVTMPPNASSERSLFLFLRQI